MVAGRLNRESIEEYVLEIMVKDGGIPLGKKVCLVINGVKNPTIVKQCSAVVQNHPQRYEKLICFHSYTANRSVRMKTNKFFISLRMILK